MNAPTSTEIALPVAKGGRVFRGGVALLLVTAVVLAIVFRGEVTAFLEASIQAIRGLGMWGPVALALIYIPACLFFLPGSVLTLGAGGIFDLATGFVAVSLGSTAGACAAFAAGRTLFRSWVEARVAQQPRFQAIDRAVARQGFKIVLLTRLSPAFPFNLLNYAFGVTTVRFRDYALASWLGMMPGTFMYVYLGSLASAAAKGEANAWQWTLRLVGLAATIAVTVVITRVARRALAESVDGAAK